MRKSTADEAARLFLLAVQYAEVGRFDDANAVARCAEGLVSLLNCGAALIDVGGDLQAAA